MESAAAKAKRVRDAYPEFMGVFDDVVMERIWSRPGLSKRERSLITVAALISMHRPGQLPAHLRRALENGVSHEELREIFLHLAAYAGWPAAFAAIDVAMQTFGDR